MNDSMRVLLTLLLTSIAASSVPAQQARETIPEQTFRTTVNVVVAPVTVLDKGGRHVGGLELTDFRLYDNEKLQDIRLDLSYVPISLVVAIQANNRVESLLPHIKKIGPLVEGLVVGTQGEAAVVAFDHRIRLMRDFTNDSRELTKALEQINPGSISSNMIDAVFMASRLLRKRPTNHRRVLLLISETRDNGSEGRLREALLEAEISNIIVYSININRAITTLTTQAPPPRPSPYPATARHLPAGAPVTPGTVAQFTGLEGGSANFIPLFVEIFRQVKGIFIDNPLEVLTEYTGGREYSFIGQRSLEQAFTDLGEELHSQYLLSYNPNNTSEGGLHKIRVEVNRHDLEVRTRGSYWMASSP